MLLEGREQSPAKAKATAAKDNVASPVSDMNINDSFDRVCRSCVRNMRALHLSLSSVHALAHSRTGTSIPSADVLNSTGEG